MSQFPAAPAKLQPPTNSKSLCRRLGTEYVDILGLTAHQLANRQAWCQEQARRLAPVVRDLSREELEQRLVTDWDLSCAEATWVVGSLP